VHVFRQEDISLEPLHEYAKLYQVLGLSFTGRAAAAVAASSASDNPEETSIARPYDTRLASKANLQNWKKRLTDEEVRRIRSATEAVARAYYPETEW
jgi:hypothetical protein